MATTLFVKGDKTRLVSNARQETAAVFDGFKPAADVSAEDSSRADLQAQAKKLGIKANQSSEALAQQIADFKPADQGSADGGEGPEVSDESPLPETS